MMHASHDIRIVPIPREVDWLNAPALRAQVEYLITSGTRGFIFDFGETDLVDSAGMGVLIHLNRCIEEQRGSVTYVNVSNRVMRTLANGSVLDKLPTSGSQSFYSRRVSAGTHRDPDRIRTLRIPDDPSCMANIRKRISAMIEPLGLDGAAHFDFMLAIGEALGNAFDHSGSTGALHILVTVMTYPDRVVVEVTDRGRGFRYVEGELPEVTETRGRGIRLMHLLTDGVEITARGEHPGAGTRVRLLKLI